MTSVLRLGSKDRSSFSFFNKRQNAPLESSNDEALAHRLPDISPIDTKSFSGLFDEFMSNETNDLTFSQDFLLTPVSPLLPNITTSEASIPSSIPTKVLETKVDLLKVNIARNGSTASSCYSQPSQGDCDFSPLVTRQSSSSSYTPEPTSAQSKSSTTRQPKPLTIPKRSTQHLAINLTESPTSARASPLRSKSALIRVVSMPPNLDKPLPPGPTGHASKPSASVPDLLLRHAPAELPSAQPDSSKPSMSDHLQRTTSNQVRISRPRRGSEGSIAMEMPGWSSRSIRQDQSTQATGNDSHMHRSVSSTDGHQPGRSLADKSRRHTVDMRKLATAAPSSRLAQVSRKHNQRAITATTAESVIYKIMCSVHTAQDLQATAMVSKGFYRTFQRNQSKLVSHLMFKSSKAAWELRRSSITLKGTHDFLLKDFRRDCRTIEALKAFVVAHCSANCKPSTLNGLIGHDDVRSAQIDDALWRIWTFCTLFGNTVGPTGPATAETDWLKGSKATSRKHPGEGFGIGNGKGLTIRELEDMSEMWQCLQVLVSGFHGREQEAQRCGVFDNWHLRESTTDSQHLAEWTCYLLAQGPQTILTLSGCSFEQAKMLGLTSWPLPPAGQSRSSFLTAAIAQVYQERILEDATRRAARLSVRRTSAPARAPSHRPTRSLDEQQLVSMPAIRADRMQAQSLRIDTSRQRRKPVSAIVPKSTTSDRMDIRPDCDPASARFDLRPDCDPAWRTSQASAILPTSPTTDPTVYYSMAMTSTASARLGATLFPMDYDSPAPRVPLPAPERPSAPVSEVVDPVDKAMNLLVHELGFPETRARKALAMCDTGAGIDLQKAIALLSVDAKEQKKALPIELPTPGSFASPTKSRSLQPPKAFCDGHCKSTPNLLHSHSRNLSTGTTASATDVSASPISIGNEAKWQDTILPPVPTSTPALKQGTLDRVTSKAKAWKMLSRDSAPKRKTSVLRIDEYQAKVERRKSIRAASIEEQSSKIREGLGKNLLGMSLGVGSNAGAKSVEEQLNRAREDERRKKDKNKASCMPRYA